MKKRTILFVALFSCVLCMGLANYAAAGDVAEVALQGQPPDVVAAAQTGRTPSGLLAGAGQFISGAVGGLLEMTAGAFLYIINALLYGILYFLTIIMGYITHVMTASITFTDVVNNGFVTAGWSAVVQYANLFFIVFLLVIAFATILDIGEYSYESLLWRLLLAAVMINFSKVICGFFIDMSNIITLDRIRSIGGKNVGEQLMETFRMGKVFGVSQKVGDPASGVTGGMLDSLSVDFNLQSQLFLTLLMNIVFTLGAIFICAALAVMFLIRLIALMILVILFPIVWVMWILPKTRSYWNEWWSSFLKWNLFGPVCSFFLALSISQLNAQNSGILTLFKNKVGMEKQVALQATQKTQGLTDSIDWNFFFNYVIIFGFMAASLIVAQKMGIAGAGAAMTLAKRTKAAAGKELKYQALTRTPAGAGKAWLDERAERKRQKLETQQGLYRENIARGASGREKIKDVRGEAAAQVGFERTTLGMTEQEKIKRAHTLQEAARADKEAGLGTTTVSAAQARERAGAAGYLAKVQRTAPGRVTAALKEEGTIQEEAMRENKARELRAQEGMTDEVMALEMKKYDLERKHIKELSEMTEKERTVQQPRMAEEVKFMGDDIKRIKQRDEYEKTLNKNSKLDESDIKALLAHFDTGTKNEKRLREMTLEEETIRRPRIEIAESKEKARLEKIAEIKYDGRNQGLEGKAFADFVASEKIKRGVTEDTQEKFVKQLKELMEGPAEKSAAPTPTPTAPPTPPPAAPATPTP
jgi:hypothetical protein